MEDLEFRSFGKIARLSRPCVITEKIDGTNGCVFIRPVDGGPFDPLLDYMFGGWWLRAGSRTRWVHPGDDNYGFAAWVQRNATELSRLGAGRHFGEWWGQGIQRKYGLAEKRFSLFNTSIWDDASKRPACCHVVPVLYSGMFFTDAVDVALDCLRNYGSHASPGFPNPEGVIVYHTALNGYFKKAISKDEEWKGKAQ